MRTYSFVFSVLALSFTLGGQELAISTPAPEWRQPSVGRPWSLPLAANAGVPLNWAVAEGALPPGIHLVDLSTVQLGAPSGPALFGAPGEPGAWSALLRAEGPDGMVAEKWFEVTVSLISLRQTYATATIGERFEFRPEPDTGVAPFALRAPEEAFIPLGLTLSADGVLSGEALIPGRYEVPIELKDAGANTLRTTLNVTVYGAETSLPPVAVRLKRDGCRLTAEWPELPEQITVELFGGEGGKPLEVVVSHRDTGDRVRAVYAAECQKP